MKTKPTYVDLFTRLHFDDWKRLRTSSYESLRPEDREAIVKGILKSVAVTDVKFYMCPNCGRFIQQLYITVTRPQCYTCNIILTEKNEVINLLAL